MSTDTRSRSDELRALYEKVAEAKKALLDAQKAFGPEPVENWALTDLDGSAVHLADLFGDYDDLLVVHNMGRGCNYCTLWADGFRGYTDHLERRCAFVLCSNDPPQVVKDFSAERGWNFRCVSGASSDFASTMGFMSDEGKPWPGVSAFHKNGDGSIVRTGSSPFGPGDDFCPVWPFFDLLEDGAKGWEPR